MNSEFKEQLEDLETILSETSYHVKHCNQDGRENELIFDPIGANQSLQEEYENRGWQIGANLKAQGYSGGRDIDLYKSPIAGEIQFSHYTSLDSDMNRLQRLYEGRLTLANEGSVQAGVVVVVVPDMPTSQSVSHFQQATTRAAPESLVSCPTVIYGIEPPNEGEGVIYNHYAKPRSRDIISQDKIDFAEVYYRDDLGQQGLSDFTDDS